MAGGEEAGRCAATEAVADGEDAKLGMSPLAATRRREMPASEGGDDGRVGPVETHLADGRGLEEARRRRRWRQVDADEGLRRCTHTRVSALRTLVINPCTCTG
jgi:hypothetical protein